MPVTYRDGAQEDTNCKTALVDLDKIHQELVERLNTLQAKDSSGLVYKRKAPSLNLHVERNSSARKVRSAASYNVNSEKIKNSWDRHTNH